MLVLETTSGNINKVEFDHHRVKPNTQAFYGWHS